jgi:hypothetical protein
MIERLASTDDFTSIKCPQLPGRRWSKSTRTSTFEWQNVASKMAGTDESSIRAEVISKAAFIPCSKPTSTPPGTDGCPAPTQRAAG